MRKRMGKLLSVLLTLVMVVGLMPATAMAAEDYYGKLEATDASVTLDGTNPGTVTVSLVGNAYMDVYAIQAYWDTKVPEDTGKLILSEITTDISNMKFTGMNYVDAPTGTVMWSDDSFSAPAVVNDGTRFLNATYTVAADTPPGKYTVRLKNVCLTATDYNNYTDQIYWTATITVKAAEVAVEGVSLNKSETTLTEGATETLTATVIPDNATDKTVTWTSSDEDVATVDANGKVTAVAAGTATITVTTEDGDFTATCVVTVEEAPCTHTDKTNHAEQSSTCKDKGWDAYSECNDCGQLFDGEGTAIDEIPERALAAHTPQEVKEGYLKTEGDCQNEAVYYKSCSVCKVKLDDTFEGEVGDHKMSSEWTPDGNGKHYHACTVNGCDHKTDEADCSGGTATCIAKAKCATCEGEYGEKAEHDFDETEWGYRESDGHAHVCETAGCNEKDTVVEHTPDREAPTENDDQKCTVCEYVIAPALGHKCEGDNLTHVPADENSCTEDGNIEHYTCTCGKYYAADKTTEIEKDDVVVPNLGGHKDPEWKYNAEVHWKECTVCESTTIEPEKHTDADQNGICDVCKYDGRVLIELSVVKNVEQKGNQKPSTETFKFELVTNDNTPAGVVLTDDSIKTDGTDKAIVLAIPADMLANGYAMVQLKEVNDGKAHWTYDDTVYVVEVATKGDDVVEAVSEDAAYDVDFYTVGEDGKYVDAEELSFTNSYDYSKSSSSGSSGGSTKYTVTLEDTDNGSVESNRTKASKGTTVTITVDPEAGYEVDDIVVETKAGKEVEVTDKGDGKFTFKMPAANVTVSVDFAKADVEDSDAKEEVEYIQLTIDSVIAWVFDEYVANDVAPVIRNARTMLPARFVAEALGGVVTWNEEAQKVTIVNGEDTIEIFIGEPFATVNGNPVELDSPAFIENDRTYLPIRFIAENMGATVTWDADARTVTIVPGE